MTLLTSSLYSGAKCSCEVSVTEFWGSHGGERVGVPGCNAVETSRLINVSRSILPPSSRKNINYAGLLGCNAVLTYR